MNMRSNPRLNALVADQKFDEAIGVLLREEEARALSPSELVQKGIWIQLGSETMAHTLDEAERSFQTALEIDENYVPALIELAFFKYSVQDNATAALPFFERAIEESLSQLREAVEGKAKCLAEITSTDAAQSFIREISTHCLDVKTL